jgi:trimeric autotransporter adhesin
VALSITPNPGNVELGASQIFRAAIASNGPPDTSVRWSLSGAACASGCGALSADGIDTAPQILPIPATAIVTAQSVADPSKQSSAALTITSNFLLQISAPASIPVSGSATIAATLTPAVVPTRALRCHGHCPGRVAAGPCGVLNVVTTQSSGGPSGSSATYTAPPSAPNPNTVTISVTPLADPSKKTQATIMVQPGVGISLLPGTATLAANHRITLTAQVFGSSNTGVTWTVNGIAGGNSTFGQICAISITPCQAVPTANSLQVDYLAPGTIPSANPVTVSAVSLADPTKSATVINHVVVSVLPNA